jgi:Septum formation
MSSKFTGDAKPDAGPGIETDQTLPTEIVENLSAGAGAGAVTVAGGTEAEFGPAESGPAPEPIAQPAPGQPTEVMDAAGPADDAATAELPAGEDGAEAGAEAQDRAEAEAEDREYLAELPAGEPTELLAMPEPVDMAEPIEVGRPRRRRWHSVLIVFGFLVAAVAIIAGAIAIVGSLTHGFKKPVVIHYTKSAVFSLKTGECIDPNGQTATIVSCGTPHDAEVFATFALPGSKWPGTAAVGTAASSGCSSRLSGYLNPQLAISLSSTYVYPDSVAWQAGTRTVICEVRATQGQLTGSVQGANATAG